MEKNELMDNLNQMKKSLDKALKQNSFNEIEIKKVRMAIDNAATYEEKKRIFDEYSKRKEE